MTAGQSVTSKTLNTDPASATAAIISITQFGGKLAHALYELGADVAFARKDFNRVAERVNDYTSMLDILEAALETTNHVFSAKAEAQILKHCESSWDLFKEIKNLLPARRDDHGRVEPSWLDKLKWNFPKSRVELSVGELEYFKTNVMLLLLTQVLGKKIRSYKRSQRKGSKKEQEMGMRSVQQQAVKANNAILQHMHAAENLSKLQNDANEDDEAEKAPANIDSSSKASSALTLIARQNEVISEFQQAVMKVDDPGDRQALIINQSPTLLQDLLSQWTRNDLDVDEKEDVNAAATETEIFEMRESLEKSLSDKTIAEECLARAKHDNDILKAELGRVRGLLDIDQQENSLQQGTKVRPGHPDSFGTVKRPTRPDSDTRHARTEKSRKAYVVDPADSDSDNANFVSRVTASTVRPSKSGTDSSRKGYWLVDPADTESANAPFYVSSVRPSKSVPRHHETPSTRSSAASQRRAYVEDDDDIDRGTFVPSSKWDMSKWGSKRNFICAIEYMAKAAPDPNRPQITRGYSFWGPQKAATQMKNVSYSEKRPASSRERRRYDEIPIRRSMPTQNSAPSHLKARVEERARGKERRSAWENLS